MSNATPLRPILVFTFLNSVSAGVVTSGVSLLAAATYGFGARANYLLGSVVGVTYVVGALSSVPVLRRLQARFSTRTVLAGIVVALSALAALPALAPSSVGSAPLWVVVGVYSPLSGMFWPVVQAYLSSDDRDLSRAVPQFNVVWAGAVWVGFTSMAPFLERHPFQVFVGLAGVQLASLLCLHWFAREPRSPQPSGASGSAPAPSVSASPLLLRRYRAFLPASYLWMCALVPLIPTVCRAMAVPLAWTAIVAATWTFSRVFVFGLLGRWKGWLGESAIVWTGAAMLVGGFVVSIASAIAGPMLGLPTLVVGLLVFGAGMGTIYTGALTYALLQGPSDVASGSRHEALIGVGYAVGPLCGLLATVLGEGLGLTGFLLGSSLLAGGLLVAWGLRPAR